MPREHGLEVDVRRPDPMHPMLIGELPAIDVNSLSPCEPASRPIPGFEDQRLEFALGEVQGGSQPRHASADDDGIVIAIHCRDYILFRP